jgi:hypothetical protein
VRDLTVTEDRPRDRRGCAGDERPGSEIEPDDAVDDESRIVVEAVLADVGAFPQPAERFLVAALELGGDDPDGLLRAR